MSPTRLILVRHGQAHCNVARVIGGRRGCTGLTEHGRHQARLLGDRLRADHTEQPLTAAYTTPVPRTRETADIITDALALPIPTVNDLREPDYVRPRPWLSGHRRRSTTDSGDRCCQRVVTCCATSATPSAFNL